MNAKALPPTRNEENGRGSGGADDDGVFILF